ncbi:MAG: phage holin [Carnobacterium sp.]|uniref:phage holin n=1 Tax=Carnobacterium sp. TaxID=48221 RepID=UPI003C72563D
MNKINLKGINKSTWVRLVGLFVILLNQISISIFNFQLLPFADEEIYEGVSTILTIILSVLSTWKDTPITVAGQKGSKLTKELKSK